MNVLIINLTRFGDLIQTQPVVSGYKSLGHRVALVCLENFASAATLLDGVDEVFPFPGAGLLSSLDDDWRNAVRDAVEFKANVLASFPPDRTVNLTPSVSSRLLTYDLSPTGGDVVGFSVDAFGFNADTSSWAAFLQMAGGNRGASPFNVCDIFRRTAGLMDEGNSLELSLPDETTLFRADDLLSGAPTEAAGFLAIQMGASEERRRWPVAHFVEIAENAWKRDRFVPVLLGSKGESELGERFVSAATCPSINLIGATSLTELGGVLCRCKALVTNDTGTMHLAAGLGVPLCAVFLATAQPWDTGPYRAGNICLEPDMECHPCEFGGVCHNDHACRQRVSPEAMDSALQTLLADVPLTTASGARVWQTRIGSDRLMELSSLSGHENSDRALWIGIQRAHYLSFLDRVEQVPSTGFAQRMSEPFRHELFKVLTDAHDMLFLFSQQSLLLTKNPRPQAKKKFLASWQRLQNILAASPRLNVLGLLWMFESQRCGDEIEALFELIERYTALFASLRDEFV